MKGDKELLVEVVVTPPPEDSPFSGKLAKHLQECNREGAETAAVILAERPRAEALQAVTHQFVQAFMHVLQVPVEVVGWHDDIDKVTPSEFTLHQAYKGDFEGEVYLNLSATMMLKTASRLLVEPVDSVTALVTDGNCEFLNVVNGNACVHLSAMGFKVEIDPPLCFCHPNWGERSGARLDLYEELSKGALTVVTLACPAGQVELCIVDRTP